MFASSYKEAKLKNLRFYFTGKYCKNGHVCERMTSCRMCILCSKEEKKYRIAWKLKNTEHIKKQNKEYKALNSEYWKKYSIEKYKKNREKILENGKKWRKNNPGKSAAIVRKRQAALKKRLPKWANLSLIRNIYEEAARLSKKTNIKYHVDHIIPLQGKNVSGLHVENNLQILKASENIKKHNSFL